MKFFRKAVTHAARRVPTHRQAMANDIVKLIGKVSILMGVFLVVVGLQPADASESESTPASSEELASADDPPDPSVTLSIQSSFQPTPLSGRQISTELNPNKIENRLDEARPAINLLADFGRSARASGVAAMRQSEPKAGLQAADAEAVEIDWLAPKPEIEWLDVTFVVSHYTFALEADPLYVNDGLVSVPGLPPEDKYRAGFIFGGRGIILQGTGLAENGRYITIDWDKSVHNSEDVSQNVWVFKYGKGRPVQPWRTVATHYPDLPQGTIIVIESYLGEFEFMVGDAGLDLAEAQVDIFVGEITIAEADQHGVKWSRVGIVRPPGYFESLAEAELTDSEPMSD